MFYRHHLQGELLEDGRLKVRLFLTEKTGPQPGQDRRIPGLTPRTLVIERPLSPRRVGALIKAEFDAMKQDMSAEAVRVDTMLDRLRQSLDDDRW
jgi:hypothetical protein